MNARTNIHLLLVLLVALWCGLIIAAPVLKSAGLEQASTALYQFFHRICHQLSERSFYLAGEKLAVCHRCTAIYGSFLAASILLLVVRKQTTNRPLSRRWLLLLVPMILDAMLNDLGFVHSTTTSRLLTGLLAGGVLPWFVVPTLVDAIQQLRHSHLFFGEPTHVRKTQ
ncbi:MAG: DUF2085 domain-containing protein [Ignavibacteriales bacterium]|nr:DUF2085 domain-containing protein [Ignavibacteriales bacterium]